MSEHVAKRLVEHLPGVWLRGTEEAAHDGPQCVELGAEGRGWDIKYEQRVFR